NHPARVDGTVNGGRRLLCRAADALDPVCVDKDKSVGKDRPLAIDGYHITVLDQNFGHSQDFPSAADEHSTGFSHSCASSFTRDQWASLPGVALRLLPLPSDRALPETGLPPVA